MPFGCMPSTIVGGVMKKLARDLGHLPMLSLSYDGQQDPTLATRLEAFMHQAQAYHDARSHRAPAHPRIAAAGPATCGHEG
jgi:predicted nucleotide-binding protein (sugar kinase/HSP70/actin superfamily)